MATCPKQPALLLLVPVHRSLWLRPLLDRDHQDIAVQVRLAQTEHRHQHRARLGLPPCGRPMEGDDVRVRTQIHERRQVGDKRLTLPEVRDGTRKESGRVGQGRVVVGRDVSERWCGDGRRESEVVHGGGWREDVGKRGCRRGWETGDGFLEGLIVEVGPRSAGGCPSGKGLLRLVRRVEVCSKRVRYASVSTPSEEARPHRSRSVLTLSLLVEPPELLEVIPADKLGRHVVDAEHGHKVWDPLCDVLDEVELSLSAGLGAKVLLLVKVVVVLLEHAGRDRERERRVERLQVADTRSLRRTVGRTDGQLRRDDRSGPGWKRAGKDEGELGARREMGAASRSSRRTSVAGENPLNGPRSLRIRSYSSGKGTLFTLDASSVERAKGQSRPRPCVSSSRPPPVPPPPCFTSLLSRLLPSHSLYSDRTDL